MAKYEKLYTLHLNYGEHMNNRGFFYGDLRMDEITCEISRRLLRGLGREKVRSFAKSGNMFRASH